MNFEGNVLAEGESSFSILDGEGGGGRIYIHNHCWMEADQTSLLRYYNFSMNSLSANAGERIWALDSLKE